MYNESYYKKIEVQMEKVCVLIISEKNPKKLNQLMNEHHRLYDIWKKLYNETPQQQKRGLNLNQILQPMNQTLNLIT